MDSCALPFTLQSLGTTPNYVKYDAWRQGDDYLDWFGAEAGQGYYQGIPASGTPMAWTTNTPGVDGYQELNVYVVKSCLKITVLRFPYTFVTALHVQEIKVQKVSDFGRG